MKNLRKRLSNELYTRLSSFRKWYWDYVGIKLKVTRVHCNGEVFNTGNYCIAGRHPLKSITWIWAVYFDIENKWYQKIYIIRQKAIWK